MQVKPLRVVARWLWVMLIAVCSACQPVAIKPDKRLPDKAETRPLGEQPKSRTALRSNVAALTELANSGDGAAQVKLGLMYAEGKGAAKDEMQAVFWFRKAAEQGYAGAQFNLGVMYEHGRGVAKDERQAVFWYRKAAEQGLVVGQRKMGLVYALGLGVAQDDVQAVFWFRKAAEQGDVEAQTVVGDKYFAGEGVAKDYGQAVFWYRKAAEQGHARAQGNLGLCYELGLGVRKDQSNAMYWYGLAAQQGEVDAVKKLQQLKATPGFSNSDLDALKAKAQRGDPKAQLELGDRYYTGNGLPRDMDLGNEWHRKALPYLKQQAERGDAESQYKVGTILWHLNRGPAPEVWPWYQRAAAQGHAGAIRELREMPGADQSERPVILETKSLIDFLPLPPDARDLSQKFCRNEPARMTDRSFERKLLSSGALEILGDWARKHYAPGRTRQDCPKVNQYNTLIAWNYTLGTGNYSGSWTNEDVDRFIAERRKAEMAMAMASPNPSRAQQAPVMRSNERDVKQARRMQGAGMSDWVEEQRRQYEDRTRKENDEYERQQREKQRQIDEENFRRQQEMARQDDERRARQQEFQREVDRAHGY